LNLYPDAVRMTRIGLGDGKQPFLGAMAAAAGVPSNTGRFLHITAHESLIRWFDKA
jgi:hypothetical protein